MDQQKPPSKRVIESIAAEENVEPTELGPPLYETVDLEALDKLVESASTGPTGSSCLVEFVYMGYSISVSTAGDVELKDTENHRIEM